MVFGAMCVGFPGSQGPSPEGWFCLRALVAVWIQTDRFPSFLFWGHILQTPFGEGSLYSMLVNTF